MSIDLADYQIRARDTVKNFWRKREVARQKQIESGKVDQGERAGVTAGKNMDHVPQFKLVLITSLCFPNSMGPLTQNATISSAESLCRSNYTQQLLCFFHHVLLEIRANSANFPK